MRAYAIKLPGIRMICVVKITTAGGEYGVGESGLSFRELAVKGVSAAALPAAGPHHGRCWRCLLATWLGREAGPD